MPTSVPSDTELDRIVEKVKFISTKGKKVTDADLYEIAEASHGHRERDAGQSNSQDIAIMTGNHVIPTASVKALV